MKRRRNDNGFVDRPLPLPSGTRGITAKLLATAANGKAVSFTYPPHGYHYTARAHGLRLHIARRDGKFLAWCSPLRKP